MTASRDPDRLIREFIDDGLTELPDRAYDAVRSEIDHTRQRVGFGPWRFRQMSAFARYAVGAGVVGLVAIVGLQLFSLGGLTTKPSPPPSVVLTPAPPTAPPATAPPTVAPTATPVTLNMGGQTALQAGRYVTDGRVLVPMGFTVPIAWEGDIWSPYTVELKRIGGPTVWFQTVSNVYKDPCHSDRGVLSPAPGRSVSDLANAFVDLPGLTVTGPTDGSIAGLPAQELTLKNPDSLSGCNPDAAGNYLLWQATNGDSFWSWPGETNHLWIVDAGGQRLVIDTEESPRFQNGPFTEELQSVLGSLVIGP